MIATSKPASKPKPPKPRKCRCGCGQVFLPRNSMHIAYGLECSLLLAQKKRTKVEKAVAKEDRKATREAKERLKTKRDYMKEAQSAFNAYIRERDKGQRCICCDQPLGSGDVGGQYDCGHYRSVGSAPHLRFDERNAHAQRKQCNRWGAGRAVDYRLGLIRRLGLEAVEAVESDQEIRKWTSEELIEIRNRYRLKLKQ